MGSEEKTKMRNGAGSWPLEYDYAHPKMVSLLAGIIFNFIPGDSQPQLGVRMGRTTLTGFWDSDQQKQQKKKAQK